MNATTEVRCDCGQTHTIKTGGLPLSLIEWMCPTTGWVPGRTADKGQTSQILRKDVEK